jgi:hypothetical protein
VAPARPRQSAGLVPDERRAALHAATVSPAEVRSSS